MNPFRLGQTQGRFLRTGLSIALVLCFALGAPLAASAQKMLRDAKTAQQVGEKLDGFLGLVDENAPANVKKMVKDTNERRLDRYQTVARLRGSTLESVGKQAAADKYKRATSGQLLETADGKWKKKE